MNKESLLIREDCPNCLIDHLGSACAHKQGGCWGIDKESPQCAFIFGLSPFKFLGRTSLSATCKQTFEELEILLQNGYCQASSLTQLKCLLLPTSKAIWNEVVSPS